MKLTRFILQEVDETGKTVQGWESSPSLCQFSLVREYNPHHRYRRRRWRCKRGGLRKGMLVDGVNAFFQPTMAPATAKTREKKSGQTGIQVAIQVGDGRVSLTSVLPLHGTVHGVIRVAKSRWPETIGRVANSTDTTTTMFELNYSVTPLDGDWGLLTRCMFVSSRFFVRNDSKNVVFEVKQSGTSDSTAIAILPGQSEPFHWGDFRLPELVSVRPAIKDRGQSLYRWSGGFDPLSIGQFPIRTRKEAGPTAELGHGASHQDAIYAIKMEAEIRPRTGGTGIVISLCEEDTTGAGSLYRIDNFSSFPVWLCQDDLLADPSQRIASEYPSDLVQPMACAVFALDVPYRQGKYANRKAAPLEVLLRVRLALAPFGTRPGIETTKVVSLATFGETVRLNPSKLSILDGSIRRELQDARVVGIVNNDGPTRVLTLR
jgi:SHR-binding domain of vacuolar-sorting associated protein 13